MWQSSGKFQPRAEQLAAIAPLIIEMGCFARVETNGGAFEQVKLLAGENPNDAVRAFTKDVYKRQELYISDDVFAPNKMTTEQGEQRQLVTVTLEALEESKRLVFLALGQDVRHAVGHIINLLPEAKAYPANFLAAKIPWVHLFADDQAMREKSYAIY